MAAAPTRTTCETDPPKHPWHQHLAIIHGFDIFHDKNAGNVNLLAMSGLYVDDFLRAGPSVVVSSLLAALRKMWKTSDPQHLTTGAVLPFLGVSIRMTKDGLLLHQHHYTLDFLREHSSHISAQKRTLPPDPSNSEHQECVKRGQKILVGLRWLSTCARPDPSYSISPAAQFLTKDVELLKVKLRRLLRCLNSTQTLGVLCPYPRRR